MKTLLAIIAFLPCCASSKLYDRNGRKVADFQGDMKSVEYSMSPDGSVRLTASEIDHSSATLAQGVAAQGKIQAAGAAIGAAGLGYLIK